jgi:hypothetical protein
VCHKSSAACSLEIQSVELKQQNTAKQNKTLNIARSCKVCNLMGLHHWQCREPATVAHSSKIKQSGKDSVIEGQPLLLYKLWAGD